MIKISLSWILLFICQFAIGQTMLINPNAGGGFQLGTSFASNGWTEAGFSTTPAHRWTISATPNGFSGNSAHISTTPGTSNSWNYSFTSNCNVHFYQDITFPAGETDITLSFKWKAYGEDAGTTFNDALLVSLAPTTFTPTSAAASITTLPSPAVNLAILCSDTGTVFFSKKIPLNLVNNCSAPSTMRLIFTWKNNNTLGFNPPAAIDSIRLTSAVQAGPALNSGPFTINNTLPTSGNNFQSFSEAFNWLNNKLYCSTLTNPIIFNVSAGQNFYENPPALFVSGTASNPVIFQKVGNGPNPVVYPEGGSMVNDYGICLNGADYITFDGINVSDPGEQLEFGYLIKNISATDGAQNNTFKNFRVTMNNGNPLSKCIMSSAATTMNTFGFTPTSSSGGNHNNHFMNFSLESTAIGMYINNASAAFSDTNIIIGTQLCNQKNYIGDNTPDNIGNTDISYVTYGVYMNNQKNVTFYNTDIRNIGNINTVYGVYAAGLNGDNAFFRNNIHEIRNYSQTSTICYGMYLNYAALTGSHQIKVFSNTISQIESAYNNANSASRIVRGISLSGTSTTPTNVFQYIENNSIRLSNPSSFTGSSTCLELGSVTKPQNIIRNNIFCNLSVSSISPSKNLGMYVPSAAAGIAGSLSNFNNFYLTNPVQSFPISSSSVDYSIATWGQATGQDVNSVSINPMFASPSDLHITNTQMGGIGTNPSSFVPGDIDCQNYTSPYTIGADHSISCSASNISAGYATKDKPNHCVGDQLMLADSAGTYYLGVSYQWKLALNPAGPYVNIVQGTGYNTPNYISNPLLGANVRYYVCELTCANGGVVQTPPVQVSTYNKPTVTASMDTLFACGGADDTLTVTGNALSYTWLPGIQSVPVPPNSLYTNTLTSTRYIVSGDNIQGCIRYDTVHVLVYDSFSPPNSSTSTTNVCSPGQGTLTTSASISNNSGLKITEVALFRNGTGATSPYPAYCGTNDADFIEISNLGTVPLNISGYTVDVWTANSKLRTYTAHQGLVMPPLSTMVLTTAIGVEDTNNRFFMMSNPVGGINNSGPLSSGSLCAIVLRKGSTILDVLRCGAYNLPNSSNITPLDWSGVLFNKAGRAGVIRTNADNNSASDWIISSTTDLQSIGTINPTLTPINTAPSIVYAWSPSANLNDSTLMNPTFSNLNTSTSFTVNIKDQNTQCEVLDTLDINIYPTPNVVITNPPGVCQPETVNASLLSSIYAGSFLPTGSIVNIYDPTFTIGYGTSLSDSGLYKIVINTSYCADTGDLIVNIHTKPELTISPTNVVTNCEATYNLTQSPNITVLPLATPLYYYTDAMYSNPVLNPLAYNMSDTVFVKAENNFCSDSAYLEVLINAPYDTISNQDPNFFFSQTGNIACGNAFYNDGDSARMNDGGCYKLVSIKDTPDGISLGNVTACDTIYQFGTITHNNQPYVQRVYTITPSNNGAADVCLYYTDDDMSNYNAYAVFNAWPLLPQGGIGSPYLNNVSVSKVNGPLGAPGTTATAIPINPSDIQYNPMTQVWSICFHTTGFSTFYLHSTNPNNTPLPVQSTPLTGSRKGETIVLDWTTLSEKNNRDFIIERSTDGKQFSAISEPIPTKALNGFSENSLVYQYIDSAPENGFNYYRYLQTDIDGRRFYSNTVKVFYQTENIVRIFPNPAKSHLIADFFVKQNGQYQIKISDMTGRILRVVTLPLTIGQQQTTIDLSGLSSGVFQFSLSDGKSILSNHLFTKE
ncbi:MAG: T9SS type A sorting domain-containing protein [Chitinophagaceae bacterium]|nr:T9SS type A sorting domain-containing protein [Chitinophagaceae bacterium]